MQAFVSVVGRVLLCTIIVMSAVGNKIPKFTDVAGAMKAEGVPQPEAMLAGAIVFLLVGAALVVLGYQARIGAALLPVNLRQKFSRRRRQSQLNSIRYGRNRSISALNAQPIPRTPKNVAPNWAIGAW